MKVMPVPSDDSVRDAGDPDRADSSRLIVTIDGPAGTGKSSVARMVATRVGLTVLDTGAMYRAAALLTLRLKIDPKNGVQIAEAIGVHRIEMDFDVEPANVLLDGDDPGDEIRGSEVESIVSVVAAHPEVRERLVAVQRAIARSHSRLVTEGRDQGSVVFPDADARFFLTASSGVRAKRRVDQLRAMGREVDPDSVLQGIEARDRIDAGRADGPLIRPQGAIEIETDSLTLAEVVDRLVEIVEIVEATRDSGGGS
jgi:cytidylate kinase